jgi:PAS domain S-box-containing protein
MSGKNITEKTDRKPKNTRLKAAGRTLSSKSPVKKSNPNLENDWQVLVENNPDVLIKLDRHGKILYINRTFSGQSTSKVIGKSIFDFLPAESHKKAKECLEQALKTGETVSFNTTATGPDGRELWYSGRFGLLDKSKGYLIGTARVSTEISEHNETKIRLQESEQKFGKLVETLAEGVGLVDAKETFLFANPAAEKIFGVKPGKLLGRNLSEFLGQESKRIVREETGKRKEGVESTYELNIESSDGQTRNILVAASPNFDFSGRFIGTYASFRDVTEQNRIQEKIQHLLRIEHALAKASALLVSAKSDNLDRALAVLGEAVKVDHAYLFLLHDDIGQMINTHSWSAAESDGKEDPFQILDVVNAPWCMSQLTAGKNLVIPDVDRLPKAAAKEQAYLKERGCRATLAVPIHSSTRQLLGLICFDDTKGPRQWADEDLGCLRSMAESLGNHLERERTEKDKRLLTTAVEQTVDGLLVTDRGGIIEYVNPAFEQITGYTRTEAIGNSPNILKSGLHDDGFYGDLWETILKGQVWSGQITNQRKDGHLYETFTTISPVKDRDGRITNFVSVMRDITERLQLEAKLRQAQKLESIGQLAAGIAHEINTPTQYARDNTYFLEDSFNDLRRVIHDYEAVYDMAQRGEINLEQLKKLDETLHQADLEYLNDEIPKAIMQSLEGLGRIAEIVLAMKEFSHPGIEVKTSTDLNRAIENTITVTKNEWKYVADVVTDLDPDLPDVPCYPGEFNQVILNLIINAAHAIEDVVGKGSGLKGTIRISTRVDADWAEINISDTGAGIPKEIRERIFDPFFTSKEVGKGTGQGLTIAHSVIVEKHRGSIDFKSTEGRGTTFTIRLHIPETVEELETEDETQHSVC